MKMIGEYLGKIAEFNQIVLRAYVKRLNFGGCEIDEAMRTMYSCFMPPGESANIEAITKVFADRYNEQNPDVFSNPENAFFISYAIMMLNTDAYNGNLEDKARMTLEQFQRMTRTPETEHDPGACTPRAPRFHIRF